MKIYDLCVLQGILDKVTIMSVIWPGIGERCLCKEQEKCRSAVKSELNNIHQFKSYGLTNQLHLFFIFILIWQEKYYNENLSLKLEFILIFFGTSETRKIKAYQANSKPYICFSSSQKYVPSKNAISIFKLQSSSFYKPKSDGLIRSLTD